MKKMMLAAMSVAVLAPIGCNDRAEEREELREEREDVREEREDLREEAREDDEIFQEGQGGVFEENEENTRVDPYDSPSR